MATVYSTQRTNNRATPVVMNKANELGGRIRVAHGVYEASSLAAGDVIEMFVLPDGARLLEGSLAHDALGSSTTLPPVVPSPVPILSVLSSLGVSSVVSGNSSPPNILLAPYPVNNKPDGVPNANLAAGFTTLEAIFPLPNAVFTKGSPAITLPAGAV